MSQSGLPPQSQLCIHLHATKGHWLLSVGGWTEQLMIHAGAFQYPNGQKLNWWKGKEINTTGGRQKQTQNLKAPLVWCFQLSHKAAHTVQTTAATRI